MSDCGCEALFFLSVGREYPSTIFPPVGRVVDLRRYMYDRRAGVRSARRDPERHVVQHAKGGAVQGKAVDWQGLLVARDRANKNGERDMRERQHGQGGASTILFQGMLPPERPKVGLLGPVPLRDDRWECDQEPSIAPYTESGHRSGIRTVVRVGLPGQGRVRRCVTVP
jgi:hypothetical protein